MLTNLELTEELKAHVQRMLQLKASDFFLVPGEPPAFRVDGRIQRQDAGPLSPDETRGMLDATFGEEWAARLGGELGVLRGIALLDDLAGGDALGPQRVLITASSTQGDCVIAGHKASWQIPTPAEIELPPAVLQAAKAPNGLLIFTGPTGSGKSTAAASVVDHINATGTGHICLLGDPMEFMLEPKHCLLQHKDLGLDFPDFEAGMRAALAQDLDVLYLSEIRSPEELRMCLTVALTGHLVVTVLHARTPADAIARVARAFPAELRETGLADFAEALRCLTALKLFPKAEGPGRAAAYSVLVPDDEMRAAIAAGGDVFERKNPLPDGCRDFAASIRSLVEREVISKETARPGLAGL